MISICHNETNNNTMEPKIKDNTFTNNDLTKNFIILFIILYYKINL
jgi:hypothetical protein